MTPIVDERMISSYLPTVNCQLSTVNRQPSTVNCQPSTVNRQLSTVNRQLLTSSTTNGETKMGGSKTFYQTFPLTLRLATIPT